ncbi:MAG: sulfatase-like hydrolase/transferase [candidate division Zixibacteria bacterium]|nr:sulfatase-like hydrolase/transferase [candidate division Zixibacteria bacterium]
MGFLLRFPKMLVKTIMVIAVWFTVISPVMNTLDKPNVLLIIVDTLRADHLGYNGYALNTSPNIDSLAAEGVVFKNAYSQSGWTFPSFASIYTSLHAKDHGIIRWGNQLDSSFVTLAEVLQDNDYTTYAYPSHIGLDVISGMAQGFDYYHRGVYEIDQPHDRITSPIVHGLVKADLDSIQEPFFMMAHYFDPHSVYKHHPKFDFGNTPIQKYDSEIAFTDMYIGKLFDELKTRGLYDDMMIVFIADHGEEFLDHGSILHNQLYNEVLKVPFIVKAPNLKHKIVHTNVDQLDVAPTILGLMGVKAPQQFQGRNLFDGELEKRPIFSERGSLEGKFLQKTVIDGKLKLYDVQTGAEHDKLLGAIFENDTSMAFNLKKDPGETHNILAEEKNREEVYPALEGLFTSFYTDTINTVRSVRQLDDETIKKLRGLGYIE